MKSLLLKKLRSDKGESFAEVLISIVIMAFALLTLATMITASWRLVQNSMIDEQFRQMSIQEMDAALAAGTDSGNATLKFTTDSAGTTIVQINGADGNYGASNLLNAKYYKTTTGSEDLFSYWPVPDTP
ncbi:MAG: hypothetical protein K6E33_07310 [Lachnospiraceae bacterium]|nr:hypothetical protein [Lachnospiraceae bacterium]